MKNKTSEMLNMLRQEHIVKHLLHTGFPDIIVARVPEQANADDDAAFQCQPLLGFQELLLEAGASAECYYIIILYHAIQFLP